MGGLSNELAMCGPSVATHSRVNSSTMADTSGWHRQHRYRRQSRGPTHGSGPSLALASDVKSPRGAGTGAAGRAIPPLATADRPVRGSSHGLGVLGKSGPCDTRSADTARRSRASPRAPEHPSTPVLSNNSSSSAQVESKAHARRRDKPRDRAYATCCQRTRAPNPLFSGDPLQDVELEIPVRDHLLQPPVLVLELSQPLHVGRLQRAEVSPPPADRLRADARASSPPPAPAADGPPGGSSPSALP